MELVVVEKLKHTAIFLFADIWPHCPFFSLWTFLIRPPDSTPWG